MVACQRNMAAWKTAHLLHLTYRYGNRNKCERMIKLLFIEDNPQAIEPVKKKIEQGISSINSNVCGFADAENKLESFSPDIVILDLLANGVSPERENAGLEIDELIWDKHFCPIVVYSAEPDRYNAEHGPHPFIKSIQKGSGSPQKVLKALRELIPHVEAVKEAEKDIKNGFSRAMRDVAPYAFRTFEGTENEKRKEMIRRAGRRRLAALMDVPSNGQKLAAWEQYLCPPVCDDIQLGDILQKANGEYSDLTSYRVVLTPSCDLVSSGGRSPKAENVLVAKCYPMKTGLKDIGLTGNPSSRKFMDKLRDRVLMSGYAGNVIPFPCLPDKIPTMAADLRDLELIPFPDIERIEGASTSFRRIASVDSPFRELIAWAYLQISCRPGLPERDLESWSKEIVRGAQSSDGDESS